MHRTPTPFLRHLFRTALAAAAVMPALCGCSSDAEDLYAHERAFFKYSPVVSVHQLHTAVNNPGICCRITFSTQAVSLSAPAASSRPRHGLATEVYGKPTFVAGFVVGTPSVPDMQMQYAPVAYDLACPACYEDALITKSLEFASAETLRCPRCQRTYDLSNGGLPTSGEGNRRLLRYRISYANDCVVIVN